MGHAEDIKAFLACSMQTSDPFIKVSEKPIKPRPTSGGNFVYVDDVKLTDSNDYIKSITERYRVRLEARTKDVLNTMTAEIQKGCKDFNRRVMASTFKVYYPVSPIFSLYSYTTLLTDELDELSDVSYYEANSATVTAGTDYLELNLNSSAGAACTIEKELIASASLPTRMVIKCKVNASGTSWSRIHVGVKAYSGAYNNANFNIYHGFSEGTDGWADLVIQIDQLEAEGENDANLTSWIDDVEDNSYPFVQSWGTTIYFYAHAYAGGGASDAVLQIKDLAIYDLDAITLSTEQTTTTISNTVCASLESSDVPDFGSSTLSTIGINMTAADDANAYVYDTTRSGYQEFGLSGITSATATGLADDATAYYLKVNIDGAGVVEFDIAGEDAQTYGDLITALDTEFGGDATCSIVSGDFRITSATSGASSTIVITDGSTGINLLLALASDYVAATYGYQEWGMTGITAGTATGLFALDGTIYDFNVSINGGAAVNVSMYDWDLSTYGDMITLINTALGGAAVASIVDGDIRITSTTGGYFTIACSDGGLYSYPLFTYLSITPETGVYGVDAVGTKLVPETAVAGIAYVYDADTTTFTEEVLTATDNSDGTYSYTTEESDVFAFMINRFLYSNDDLSITDIYTEFTFTYVYPSGLAHVKLVTAEDDFCWHNKYHRIMYLDMEWFN